MDTRQQVVGQVQLGQGIEARERVWVQAAETPGGGISVRAVVTEAGPLPHSYMLTTFTAP